MLTIAQAQAVLDALSQERDAAPKWTAEDEDKKLWEAFREIGLGGLTYAEAEDLSIKFSKATRHSGGRRAVWAR
jgi:hypothetical protein